MAKEPSSTPDPKDEPKSQPPEQPAGETPSNVAPQNTSAPEEVRRVLSDRLSRFGESEFYIVYPSWKFRFSCNIVLRKQTYDIEGKYGSQKSLSAGKATPDFGLRIPFGMRSEMTCYVGSPSEEVLSWLGRILLWCKRIPKDSFYAEVALTHTPELMFYELFPLEQQTHLQNALEAPANY